MEHGPRCGPVCLGSAPSLSAGLPPCRDFDPFSLRMELPGAVAALAQRAAANGGTAYVHCTGACSRCSRCRPEPACQLGHVRRAISTVGEAAGRQEQACTRAVLPHSAAPPFVRPPPALQPAWDVPLPPLSPTCGGSRAGTWRMRTST